MLHQASDFLHRGVNELAVARSNALQWIVQQQSQRLDIGLHVATGRHNHHSRAVHDVVTGKQHAVVFQQEAVVIADMPRRMQRSQGKLGGLQQPVVVEQCCGREGIVLKAVIRRQRANHLGAGGSGYSLPGR